MVVEPYPSKGRVQIRRRSATGSRQGKNPCAARDGRLGRRLWLCGCGTGETRAQLSAGRLLDVERMTPLVPGASWVSFLSLDRSSLLKYGSRTREWYDRRRWN